MINVTTNAIVKRITVNVPTNNAIVSVVIAAEAMETNKIHNNQRIEKMQGLQANEHTIY